MKTLPTIAFLLFFSVTGWFCFQPAGKVISQDPAAPASNVPAYHDQAPEEELPAVLPSTQFKGDTARAYEAAARIKPVLYQLPCYCYCDRDKAKNHRSLLDCFRTEHGAQCSICKKEAIYAYDQTRAGKSPAEIRKEIIDGKWQDVRLASDGN